MPWKTISVALLCCWSLCAGAAPACAPGGKPAYTFEWVPKDEAHASLGSVRIRDAAGLVVQVLDEVENYREHTESLDTASDFNNDGCPDLAVTSHVAGIGNTSVTVFLYDRKTRRFEPSEALSAIGGLNLDARDKNCVTGEWKGGAADVHTERHCWRNGRLVRQTEYSVAPFHDAQGRFRCYRHVETVYRGGKKRQRSWCTKSF